MSKEKVFSNCDKDVIKNKKVTFEDPLYTYADAVRNNSSMSSLQKKNKSQPRKFRKENEYEHCNDNNIS